MTLFVLSPYQIARVNLLHVVVTLSFFIHFIFHYLVGLDGFVPLNELFKKLLPIILFLSLSVVVDF